MTMKFLYKVSQQQRFSSNSKISVSKKSVSKFLIVQLFSVVSFLMDTFSNLGKHEIHSRAIDTTRIKASETFYLQHGCMQTNV